MKKRNIVIIIVMLIMAIAVSGAFADSIPENLLNATYRIGTNTKEILEIKKKMQQQGYFKASVEVSGIYNELMVERVKQFQKDHGLKQTGQIDEVFLEALYGVNNSSFIPTRLKNKTYKIGSNTQEIAEIKQRMQELGYFKATATVTGNYNDLMVERIKQFQKDHGLKQTGQIDIDFLEALYNPSALGQKTTTTLSSTAKPTAKPNAENPYISDSVRFNSKMMASVSEQISAASDLTKTNNNRAVLAALLTLEYKYQDPSFEFDYSLPIYACKAGNMASIAFAGKDRYVIVIYQTKPLSTYYAYLYSTNAAMVKASLELTSDNVWSVSINDYNEKLAILVDQLK